MLTKGIITEISPTDNKFKIRMPLFEVAGNQTQYIEQAIASDLPGIFNSYRLGDVVIVGFENNNISYPIILGKLYTGIDEDSRHPGGAVHCTDLVVSNSAKLPGDTVINLINIDGARNFNTIGDFANAIRDQQVQIEALQLKVDLLTQELANMKNKS